MAPPHSLKPPNANNGSKAYKNPLILGIDDSSAAHLKGEAKGVVTFPLEVIIQPLVPLSFPVQGLLKRSTGVPQDSQL